MNTAIIVGGLGIAVLLTVGIMLSRASSRQKKQAVASLEAEKAALGSHTILDLVHEEVEDLGLRHIAGSEGLGPDVLLRAWRDAPESVRSADPAHLEFVADDRADGATLRVTSPGGDGPGADDSTGDEE